MAGKKFCLAALLALAWVLPSSCSKADEEKNAALYPAPLITTTALAPATESATYLELIFAQSEADEMTWAISAGSLPSGLQLSPSGSPAAQISGLPTVVGSFAFTIRVTDSEGQSDTQAFNLVVNAAGSLVFDTPLLPDGTEGLSYYGPFTLSGGSGTINTVSVTSGALPPGMFLDFTGTPPPAARGVPTQSGVFSFTLRAEDTAANAASRSFNIKVFAANTPLQVSFSCFPGGQVGQSYFGMASAVGGSPDFFWSKVGGGNIAPGLALTGGYKSTFVTITGTPANAGVYAFQLEVSGAGGQSAIVGASIRVDGPLKIITTGMPSAVINVAYSHQVHAEGGTQSGFAWSLDSGVLPPGLAIGPGAYGLDCRIQGTPIQLGTFSFTLRLTDSGTNTTTRMLTILVATVPNPLIITTIGMPDAKQGTAYSAQISATGGTGGFQWQILSGSLPPGLTLSPTGSPAATLSGTPTIAAQYNFTVELTDGTQTDTQYLSLLVRPPFDITTPSLPDGYAGSAYLQTISATGGSGPGFIWDLAQGSLPVGLVLAASGTPSTTLSGTPTVFGTSSFTLRVTDAALNVATRAFTLFITAGGVINTIAGTGNTQPTGEGLAPLSSAVYDPEGLVFDASGNLFFSERGNHRVRMLSATTNLITTIAGNGSEGFSGDGGTAISAQLRFPGGLAFDSAGNLYIADAGNHRVRKVSSGGSISTIAGNGVQGDLGDLGQASQAQVENPADVLVAGNSLYIACRSGRVRHVNLASGIISLFAGSGTSRSDGSVATSAQMLSCNGLARDASGNIYVSDFHDNRVRRVDAATSIITTFAGGGASSSDGIQATSYALFRPEGLAFDSAGNLHIADSWQHAVRRVDASTQVLTTSAGTGVQGFTGDGGPAVNARFYLPKALRFDAAGGLLICDSSNSRIRRVSP